MTIEKVTCPDCKGSGTEGGMQGRFAVVCGSCEGAGWVSAKIARILQARIDQRLRRGFAAEEER